jgi:hypothetical protein
MGVENGKELLSYQEFIDKKAFDDGVGYGRTLEEEKGEIRMRQKSL